MALILHMYNLDNTISFTDIKKDINYKTEPGPPIVYTNSNTFPSTIVEHTAEDHLPGSV